VAFAFPFAHTQSGGLKIGTVGRDRKRLRSIPQLCIFPRFGLPACYSSAARLDRARIDSARERSPSVSLDQLWVSPVLPGHLNNGDPEKENVAVTRLSSPRALSAAKTIRKRTREPEETLLPRARAEAFVLGATAFVSLTIPRHQSPVFAFASIVRTVVGLIVVYRCLSLKTRDSRAGRCKKSQEHRLARLERFATTDTADDSLG